MMEQDLLSHQQQELESPESSLLLVHLDRAIKVERAQAVDRIQKYAKELARAQAVISVATQRAELAESRATAAEAAKAEATQRAVNAEKLCAEARAELEAAKSEWARERQESLAQTNLIPPTARGQPSPNRNQTPVNDEMDKLMRKYQFAKEKLRSLESMYPVNISSSS